MRKVVSSLVAVCLVPLIAQAVNERFETLKVGDNEFQDVTITSVTPTDIYFTHSSGMGNAKLKKLPPDLQRQFGFDPGKAAEIEQSRRKGAAVYAAKMQEERVKDLERAEAARRQAAREELMAEYRARQAAARRTQPGQLVNQPSPPLVVEKWLGPEPNPVGKFVLIDFWATWCGPCRQSIPHLNALHEKYSDRMVIIGLSSESEVDVRKLTHPQIEYYSAIDTRGRTAMQVGVTSIPHALLIDPSGVVRYQGHPSLLKEDLVETILSRFGS